MSTKYKFYYFPIRGRGEFIRYIFAYANVPYEEIIVPRDDTWPARKNEFPMGVLPVLEFENGVKLSQSLAIGRYLASQYGLLSKDDLENAWGDQIAGSIEDLYLPFFRPVAMAMRENDQAKVKEAFDNMVNNGLAPLFERLEKMLGDKKWYCSQNVHWIDLYVAELVDRAENLNLKEFAAKFPKVLAHSRRVHELPNIKKYVQQRPKMPY